MNHGDFATEVLLPCFVHVSNVRETATHVLFSTSGLLSALATILMNRCGAQVMVLATPRKTRKLNILQETVQLRSC
jgi:hypothetical protein